MDTIAVILEKGFKEIIDFTIAPQENVLVYTDMLERAKERGLNDVDIFVTDGFICLADALLNIFPQAKHQRCWFHIARNIQSRVRQRDREDILQDLKLVYKQNTEAETALCSFLEKWGNIYPTIARTLSDITSLFTFYEMPKCIRASVYTTNIIEGFNKQLKKMIGHKEHFPNEESLERFICFYVLNYNAKNSQRIHRGFRELSYS